ncbi:DcuC family C4-dicarboxylate transporter [Anaerospora hongkongensis]|uniref:DcuC family C4-dicarboxylate transporter n=1 Tax=Anaerospora hongkongensis TaxID=244830 RepID=A0A4R1Q1K3_9FIRM|nr:C4-dicarboxylate transporter DcuC [Anaerospora hongkongensis]TCL39839.1 DcuC family C4-dicarboxylate transporter [Anaerospora hongkongensis]
MLLLIGALIILLTIYLLIKQYETRMVLFCSGLVMAIIAGDPMAAFKAFSHAMQESKIFEPIIAVMGFAMVLKVTECDKHLVHFLARYLKKAGPFLIPGAVLVTFLINISVVSASGCSAAVGAILIPSLMASGVHPAIAGSAVLAGTYGAMFNPGFAPNIVVADVAKSTPMAVVANHAIPLATVGIIGAITLTVVAYLRKENKGYEPDASTINAGQQDFQVNLLKAFVPILPLLILILGNMNFVAAFKQVAISHAMIIGVFAAFLVTRMNPGKVVKEFWHGVGEGFGHIFAIIICSLVFVSGLNAIGVIQAAINLMISNTDIAKLSATFGPFLLAIMCGSGDAAQVAFNKAVTVHAAQFGINGMDMGSMAAIGGALGRTMSPISGAAIICATFAGVNPLELAKRNAPGMIVALVTLMVLLMYK